MRPDEHMLAGGVNTVARIGGTVRRPTGPGTPAGEAALAGAARLLRAYQADVAHIQRHAAALAGGGAPAP